ncbi:MAG: hypothetical protein CMJ32_09140 [Phycisphaerae bacterium]|nr:hypothetical protein [Phycisphaerae bacterium]
MKYRLLAIDIDGTLLDETGQVSQANVEALARAREHGLEVVLATGRAFVECSNVLTMTPGIRYLIGAGGALLSETSTGRTIRRSAMPPTLSHEVATAIVEHGFLAHLLKDSQASGYDYLMIGDSKPDPSTTWWLQMHQVRTEWVSHVHMDRYPDHTVRVGTVAIGDQLHEVTEFLRDRFGDSIMCQHWSAQTPHQVTGSRTHLLEIFNPMVDKWTMFRQLADDLGIRHDQTVAIGDGFNDIAIVRQAGLGIAVANASEDVLQVADRTTLSHDRDGVAVAIGHILDGDW